MENITLTTDFGLTAEYPAAMKGVILSINPKVNIIDITHSINPQNIEHGAFVLYSVVPYFKDTIHIGVVDPGVGTERAGLIFKCTECILVGPDNGLLIPAAERLGIQSVIKITNLDYCLDDISSTFHGRDIFAPVAAHISNGLKVETCGPKVDQYVRINLFKVEEEHDKLTCKVLNIDTFGNIITNLSKDVLEKYFDYGNKLELTNHRQNKTWRVPIEKTYGNVPKGTLLATISSSGFLEIAGNLCSAVEKMNVKIGDKIVIRK